MTEWLHEEQDLANEAVDGDGGVRDGTRGQTRGVETRRWRLLGCGG
jgi:hypothetical protein